MAKLERLAGAPVLHGPIYNGDISPALAGASLLAGPIHSGAVSSAAFYKAPPIPVKTIAPPLLHEPILSAPILKEPIVPLEHGSILPYPIIKSVPNYHAPILPAPITKSGPLLGDYPLSGLYKGSLVEPSYLKGAVLEPFYNKGPLLESSYVKGPLYEPDLIGAPLVAPSIAKDRLLYEPLYQRGLLSQGVLDKTPILNWGDLSYAKH